MVFLRNRVSPLQHICFGQLGRILLPNTMAGQRHGLAVSGATDVGLEFQIGRRPAGLQRQKTRWPLRSGARSHVDSFGVKEARGGVRERARREGS